MYNFIEKYKINSKICDDLIGYFHNNSIDCGEGSQSISNGIKIIDHNVKHSIDLDLSKNSIECLNYVKHLYKCLNKYIKKYSYSSENLSIIEGINLQYYPKNGGFKKFHYELVKNHPIYCRRHLVFMTYLNNVYWGGQTEFVYQRKKFNARKGTTLIWPSEWTHTHKGIVAQFEEKYIITGWLSIV